MNLIAYLAFLVPHVCPTTLSLGLQCFPWQWPVFPQPSKDDCDAPGPASQTRPWQPPRFSWPSRIRLAC